MCNKRSINLLLMLFFILKFVGLKLNFVLKKIKTLKIFLFCLRLYFKKKLTFSYIEHESSIFHNKKCNFRVKINKILRMSAFLNSFLFFYTTSALYFGVLLKLSKGHHLV